MKIIKFSLLALIISISQIAFAQSENNDQLLAKNTQKENPIGVNQNTSTTPTDETKSKWNVNFEVSLTSRFIWRGLELGEYPSIQPNVTFSKGNFFTGIWASHSLAPAETPKGNITGYKEVIPYIGYGFKTGNNSKFTLMVLEHYNPNAGDFFKFENAKMTNRVEVRTLFNAGKFDFFGCADVVNDPSDNTSVYLEFGYTVDMPNDIKVRPLVSVVPTKSYYTTDGKANFTQIGFITSKDLKISDKFSLPVKVDMIYNPDRMKFYTSFTVTAKF
jgi:Bacterial protein of unknown function (Gcw_chp)